MTRIACILALFSLAAATSARAADDDPPAPDATGDVDESGADDGDKKPDKPPPLPPLNIPPDTEAADSGDQIGFVNVRFGVVAQGVEDLKLDDSKVAGQQEGQLDTRLQALQLRAFGALPLLDNSFFLINVRTELSPRITFALFEIPLWGGHYFSVNSGGGSLSNALTVSVAKQPLNEAQFWMINAFEQNNGAAFELHGPLFVPSLHYRLFANGGSGQSTGNIGGQRITFDNTAFTYAGGAQLTWSAIGYYNRFQTQFLYRPERLTLGFNAGAKYEQRAQERFPALDVSSTLRWGRFELVLEDYSKAELNFGQMQNAWSAMAGLLVIPEWVFVAVDGGQFQTTGFGALQQATGGFVKVGTPPSKVETDLKREVNETDVRAAIHLFFWRYNGVISLRYALKIADQPLSSSGQTSARTEPTTTHDVAAYVTFRF